MSIVQDAEATIALCCNADAREKSIAYYAVASIVHPTDLVRLRALIDAHEEVRTLHEAGILPKLDD